MPCDSSLVTTLTVLVIHHGGSPPRHCSSPCIQVQTEILVLSQTNRPGILTKLSPGWRKKYHRPLIENINLPDVREILISEVDRSFKSKYPDVILNFSVRQAVEKVGVRCSHCFRYERNRLIVDLSIVFS